MDVSDKNHEGRKELMLSLGKIKDRQLDVKVGIFFKMLSFQDKISYLLETTFRWPQIS